MAAVQVLAGVDAFSLQEQELALIGPDHLIVLGAEGREPQPHPFEVAGALFQGRHIPAELVETARAVLELDHVPADPPVRRRLDLLGAGRQGQKTQGEHGDAAFHDLLRQMRKGAVAGRLLDQGMETVAVA